MEEIMKGMLEKNTTPNKQVSSTLLRGRVYPAIVWIAVGRLLGL